MLPFLAIFLFHAEAADLPPEVMTDPAVAETAVIELMTELAKDAPDPQTEAELVLRTAAMRVESALRADEASEERTGELEQAVSLCRQILLNYPRYARADEAAYLQAFALDTLGRPDEAVELRKTIVKRYPLSHHASEAYFQIGEYFLERDNFYGAFKGYYEASTGPDEDIVPLAELRLGWAVLNIGDVARARGLFEKTLQTDPKLGLHAEARAGLAAVEKKLE